jgi:hypothetical protein
MNDQFKQEREYLIYSLRKDPYIFAKNMYSEETTGYFWNRKLITSSPYLRTNNENLCCLIGASEIKSSICLNSVVEPLTHQGKESETLLVKTGSLIQPQYHVMKVYNLDKLQIRYSDVAKYPMINYPECFYPNINNLTYLGTDIFTNEYLCGYILDDLYSKSQLDGVVKFLSATICNSGNNKKETIFMEYADLGDIINLVENPLTNEFRDLLTYTDQSGVSFQLTSLKIPVIIDICKQIIVNLDFLHKELEFNHGDLKANNILIKFAPSRGNYQGVNWNSNITLKLADFAKSSLTINTEKGRLRLYNYSSYAEKYDNTFPFEPNLGNQFNEPYYVMDANTNLASLVWIRHLGVPFYFSWDTYTLMISLLMIPEIFYPVMTNQKLRSVLFDSLWFGDDYSTVYSRLYSAVQERKENSYTTILNILNGLKLKCNANTILLEGLKTL